jgi:uncharacterized Tic20 family protein
MSDEPSIPPPFDSSDSLKSPAPTPPPMQESVNPYAPPSAAPAYTSSGEFMTDPAVRQMALILHLSQLAGYLVPVAGWIAPILIWQLKKQEMPQLDAHGKEVVNWLISCFLYGVVCGILCFFCIGIPLLIALGIVAVVFPIIGGVKANEGILWRYPLTIRFIT